MTGPQLDLVYHTVASPRMPRMFFILVLTTAVLMSTIGRSSTGRFGTPETGT